MTNKHTPGPWKIIGEDSLDGIPYIEISNSINPSPEFRNICHVQPDITGDEFIITLSEQDHANAQLIASAPELLEALEMIQEELKLNQGCMIDQINQISYSAIKKARGQS